MTRSNTSTDGSGRSRREFIQESGAALTGAALVAALTSRGYAGEDHTIKVALVGCGGRGTGAAANALSTSGPTRLWAMADLFDYRLAASHKNLSTQFPDQVAAPPERQFLGFNSYQQAIDALDPGDVVLLATPPAFRPLHLEYAVDRGCHVFMEKSFAVDPPGVRRVLSAGEKAKQKNLKIAGGLMSRHYRPLQQAIEQIRNGLIGEVLTCWAYREHGPVDLLPRRPGMTEMGHQVQNYSCFTWLNGSFLLDWLIHNLDVCCWAKGAWPVSAQGQGGRQVRTAADQLFDHYSVEYSFADGTRLMAQGRHMTGCWSFFGDVIHAAGGSAVLGEGIPRPRIYQGHLPDADQLIWQYSGEPNDAYQTEHDVLFDAVRRDLPHNETPRCAQAAMVGILGRLAAESGKQVTWDEALQSQLELAPGLDQFTMDAQPPVTPDADGDYPVAMPGFTKVM